MISVLCTSYLAPTAKSGVTTYYKKLAENFGSDSEIKISVITVADAPAIWKKIAGFVRRLLCLLSFGNKGLIRYGFESKNRILIYFALRPYRKYHFDLIHAQDILSGIVAKRFFNNKIPLILTCHFNDNPVEEDMLTYSFPEERRSQLVNYYRVKFNQVSGFIFVSEYAFKKARFLLKGTELVKIIPNGSNFKNNVAKKTTGKSNNREVISILNVGYIDIRKNQKILISVALEFIKSGFSNFLITLVGDGPDLNAIKHTVSVENLDSYFHFTGWTNNTKEYFDRADLLLHTATNDNCPYAVIEAISKKIPTFGFDVGGMPEILDSKWLFPLNDFISMASFTRKHASRLPGIATEQFENIKDRFSLGTQLDQVRSVYQSVAKKKQVNLQSA